jgi:hypothetical protein
LPFVEQPLLPHRSVLHPGALSATPSEDSLSAPEPPIDWTRLFPPAESVAVPDVAEGPDARPLLRFSTADGLSPVDAPGGLALRYAWDASAPAAWSWDAAPEPAEPSAPEAAPAAGGPAPKAVSRRSVRAETVRVPATAPKVVPAAPRPVSPSKPSVSQGEVENMLRDRLLGR